MKTIGSVMLLAAAVVFADDEPSSDTTSEIATRDYPVVDHTPWLKTHTYPYQPGIQQAYPPTDVQAFETDQNYVQNCLPEKLGVGQYYATGYFFNRSEELDIRTVLISVENSGDGAKLKLITLIESHMGRQTSNKLSRSTEVAVYSAGDAEASRKSYEQRVGFAFESEPESIEVVTTVVGEDIVCNESLKRFEWETSGSEISSSSNGHLKLYLKDDTLVMTGVINSEKPFWGLLNWPGWGTEIQQSFIVHPLVGGRMVIKE